MEQSGAAGKGGSLAGHASAPAAGSELEYEARSARDGAWYDVELIIQQRISVDGHMEVKVRFSGFGEDEDEWVPASTGVRLRSLPCEASECVAVLPGDVVLCFQDTSEQALYFDADVLDVQRRRHDVRGCRCRFWVRYRHDGSEEVVPLRKICRRPETEARLQAQAQAQVQANGSAPGTGTSAAPAPAASRTSAPPRRAPAPATATAS